MRKYLPLALMVLIAGSAAAQVLVKDHSTASLADNADPVSYYRSGSIMYFAANDGSSGAELWRTDGTPGGTRLVLDINPGGADSDPDHFAEVNGIVYFQANTSSHGRELWRTDGTAAGTWMVKDINPNFSSGNGAPGGTGSDPLDLCAVNGILFFAASDGVNGRQLWKSDGTEAGTVMVRVINPGGNASPEQLVTLNGKLLFVAGDAGTGRELWQSDGSAAGTSIVTDIYPGNSSSPDDLTIEGNILYFSAVSAGIGRELWRSDGTAAGTTLVADINPSGSSSIGEMTPTGTGVFYFIATNGADGTELWKSNGTAAGTIQVKDIYAGSGSSNPQTMIYANGVLYLTAADAANGQELWRSDGTDPGTYLLRDILPGTNGSVPHQYAIVNNLVVFRAADALGNNEPWVTDGTPAGTIKLREIVAGNATSTPNSFTSLGTLAFFSATDNVNGREVWVTDGTTAGTTLFKNINPENDGAFYDGLQSPVSDYWAHSNGRLFYGLKNGLHVSDGTTAGTTALRVYNSGQSGVIIPEYLTNVSGTIYCSFYGNSSGYELWKTDGTPAGTMMVKDISAGAASSRPTSLTNVNGTLYFAATDAAGKELWKSDGTTAGTVIVKDIHTSGSSNPQALVNLNGILLFVAETVADGRELWRSDGTDAGTYMVRSIRNGSASAFATQVFEMVRYRDHVYFTASNGTAGDELWRTDGTLAGTEMVADINPNPSIGSSPFHFTVSNDLLFFTASEFNGPASEYELYVCDGNQVTKVKDIYPGTKGSNPLDLTDVNGTLYFSAFSPDSGLELWRSDGTEAGTVQVPETMAGMAGSTTRQFFGTLFTYLANINGRLYYPSMLPGSGLELWRMDGDDPGTAAELSDIFPGPQSSDPGQLTNINGKLFFVADNGTVGKELFVYDPTVNYILPSAAGVFNSTIDPAVANDLVQPGTDYLLATVVQRGIAPVNHAIFAQQTIDATVQSYNGQPYVQRHTDIQPLVNAETSTARVTLYFTQADFDNFNNSTASSGDNLPSSPGDVAGKSLLRVIQYHGTGTAPGNYTGATEIIDPADTDIVWNAARNRWEVSFDVTGFSGFYVSTLNATLPLQLISFTGQRDGAVHRLNWVVSEQVDVAYYELERSADAVTYEALTRVEANQSFNSSYTAIDASPLHGMNFYRLNMVDIDGTSRYSHVVRLENTSAALVRIYPNPTTGIITIDNPGASILQAAVIGMDGKVLQRMMVQPGSRPVDLSELGKGSYLVIVGGKTFRIVVL